MTILLPRNRYTGKENTPGKPHQGRAGDRSGAGC
jgi:hypothetical protein